jgi:hypothetical protein
LTKELAPAGDFYPALSLSHQQPSFFPSSCFETQNAVIRDASATERFDPIHQKEAGQGS